MRSHLSVSVFAAGLLLTGNAAIAAQQPPPINGVTGTLALDSTVEKTYEGLNTVAVKVGDGIGHLFHLTQRTVVHGGKMVGDDVLRGLNQGSRVVVHYTADGGDVIADEADRVVGDGLKTVEGVITSVDRRAKTLSIRLADGSRQTFRLTERLATDVGKGIDRAAADTANVVIYVSDEAGRPVAHYFTRVS
jgi:hypothetical protein